MSRTTPHCACRIPQQNNDDNQKFNSKTYSLLPTYHNKSENNRVSSKLLTNLENSHTSYTKSKYSCGNRNENEFKNYENIEYYTSGLFRPHSCPANKHDSNDLSQNPGDYCTESTLKTGKTYFQNHINKSNHENGKSSDKYQRRLAKSNLKIDQKNVNNFQGDDDTGAFSKHYFDSKYFDYNSGLSFYMKNSHIPIPSSNDDEKRKRLSNTLYNDENILATNMKKSSCGLKYIIFQKLSIMTHFITGSKNKKSSLLNNHSNFSDDNLFKEKSPKTKRSKSYHAMDNNFDHTTCNKCENHYKSNLMKKHCKPRSSKVKLSNASNSSSGSIDAHAGSPITIMTTVCGNILSNGSNPLVSNTICHSSKTRWKNEEKSFENFPDIKETHQPRNLNSHKGNINNYQINQSTFNQHNNPPSNHHLCTHCSCSTQNGCIQMPCEQFCGHQYCTQPHVQPSHQSCHYCCCSHSHLVMHPSYSQSPYMCCSPSNFLHHCSMSKPVCLHSFFPCNSSHFTNDTFSQSILCNSCQAKNIDRCHSANIVNCNKMFWNNSSQNKPPHNFYSSSQKYRSKGEPKNRSSKPTSIPPPPPPPPSSLYSTKEIPTFKSKQKRHYSNKMSNNGKVCSHCSEKMPVFNQDGADNVQNIIYSHLNNTVACQSSKINENTEIFHQTKNSTGNCENRLKNFSRNISWNSHHESKQEKICQNANNENDQTYSSKEQNRYLMDSQDVVDRRSAEIYRHRSSAVTPTISTHKPRFISKTPETYKSKYDRRQKNHQGETKRILKHKSISTTREYNFIDQETFCRNDSIDSPEAGSFIYNPVSPLLKKTAPTVAISNLSSFNIHQQHFNLKDKRNNNPEPARKAFQENMLSLREVGWYWGPLSFTEAERLMENKANGTFLVRDSGHDTYFLSLTFRVRETTYHTRIEYSQGTFSFWSQPESHSATTISEFIDKAVAHSQSGKFHYFLLTNVPGQPPMEVSLLYPLTRNQIVHSLKHLSRFVILSNIRKDHITNLNIPSPLKLYLLEKQYYISNLDHFIESTFDAHPLNYKPSMISE